jgi:hypothetical protein
MERSKDSELAEAELRAVNSRILASTLNAYNAPQGVWERRLANRNCTRKVLAANAAEVTKTNSIRENAQTS